MSSNKDLEDTLRNTDAKIEFSPISENVGLRKKTMQKEDNIDPDPGVNVSLGGLGLPEEQTKRVESEIRQKIKREISNYLATQSQQREGDLQLSQGNLTISLGGLGLPEEQTKRVESEIREILENERVKDAKWSDERKTIITSLSLNTTCVCGNTFIPGQNMTPTWPSVSKDPATIGLYFRNMYGIVEDTAYLIVQSDPSISRDEAWIGLELLDKHPEWGGRTAWGKRIDAWNMCMGGKIGGVTQEIKNVPAKLLYIYRNRGTCFQRTDALIFSKPKEFGLWRDMYAWNLLERGWWDGIGGKRLTFKWYSD